VKAAFLRYNKLRPWLWRWHKRAGLAAAAVLILVTITGIFLNHTSELLLARKFVDQGWLLSFYGIPEPELVSYALGSTSITGDSTSDSSGRLYRGIEPLGECRGALVGTASFDTGFVVACERELLFFDQHGQLADKISATYGLPTPVAQLGECGEFFCVRTPERLFEFEFKTLAFKPRIGLEPVWSEQVQLGGPARRAIYRASRGQGLNWERVLMDLHSGRLFGAVGVWVVDIAAILLLFLALSGFVLWYQQRRIKRARAGGDPV